jgi:hypothetical protein
MCSLRGFLSVFAVCFQDSPDGDEDDEDQYSGELEETRVKICSFCLVLQASGSIGTLVLGLAEIPWLNTLCFLFHQGYRLRSQVHSTPLQYKPQFIKGFSFTFSGHHLSFKLHIIDEAMITCGLQDNEPRDMEAQSPSSHDRKIGNLDSGQTLASSLYFSVQLLRPHLSHLAMSNRRAIPFEKTGIQYSPVMSIANSLIYASQIP